MIGNELYQRMLKYSEDHSDGGLLMRQIWTPTPFMLDVNVGDDHKEREILEWCFEVMGSESSPLHEMDGCWRRGNARVYGWVWFGFETAELLSKFQRRWPEALGGDGAVPWRSREATGFVRCGVLFLEPPERWRFFARDIWWNCACEARA